ncbi:hypothetical protein [Enterococcus gallinarum]|uniref:hypothetical protein n=1 Tax=Enterococcus gallinarum TaxID=1353 RepID=UPI00288EC5D9|nr:hypothetical protein [Enterococcus gallinarum]MDT2687248.1 hypothetical protein [Enterococcus gallinarum]
MITSAREKVESIPREQALSFGKSVADRWWHSYKPLIQSKQNIERMKKKRGMI